MRLLSFALLGATLSLAKPLLKNANTLVSTSTTSSPPSTSTPEPTKRAALPDTSTMPSENDNAWSATLLAGLMRKQDDVKAGPEIVIATPVMGKSFASVAGTSTTTGGCPIATMSTATMSAFVFNGSTDAWVAYGPTEAAVVDLAFMSTVGPATTTTLFPRSTSAAPQTRRREEPSTTVTATSTATSMSTSTSVPATTTTTTDLLKQELSASITATFYPVMYKLAAGIKTTTKVTATPFAAFGTFMTTTTCDCQDPDDSHGCVNGFRTDTITTSATQTAFKIESAVMVGFGSTDASVTSYSSTITAYDPWTTEIAPLTTSAAAHTKRMVQTATETGSPGQSSDGPRKRFAVPVTPTQAVLEPDLQRQLSAGVTASTAITVVHATVLATVSHASSKVPASAPSPITVVADICDGSTLIPAILPDATTTTWNPLGSGTTFAVTVDKTTIVATLTPSTAAGSIVDREVPRATALPSLPKIPVVAPSIHAVVNRRQANTTSSTVSSPIPAVAEGSKTTKPPKPTNAIEALLDPYPAGTCHREELCDHDKITSSAGVVRKTATVAGPDGLPTPVHQESGSWVPVSARSDGGEAVRRDENPPPTDPSAVAAVTATTSRQVNNALEALTNTDPAGCSHPGDDRRDATPTTKMVPSTATIAGRDGLPTVAHQSSGAWVPVSAPFDDNATTVTGIPSVTKVVSTTLTTMIRERQMTKSATLAARYDDETPGDGMTTSSSLTGRGTSNFSFPTETKRGKVAPRLSDNSEETGLDKAVESAKEGTSALGTTFEGVGGVVEGVTNMMGGGKGGKSGVADELTDAGKTLEGFGGATIDTPRNTSSAVVVAKYKSFAADCMVMRNRRDLSSDAAAVCAFVKGSSQAKLESDLGGSTPIADKTMTSETESSEEDTEDPDN